MINKLVIVGVGLIGGSFALALRKAGQVKHIVGVGRGQENLQRALERGAIDEIAGDLPSALKNADMVFLSIPVGQTGEIMRQISPYLERNTIVTDAGSTKRNVIAAALSHLPQHLENIVPGHPIAGAELSGAGAAKPDLYRGKNVVLTPLKETRTEATAQVKDLWQACGAQVVQMSPDGHDEVLAAVSHLPHVLAFALMHLIATEDEERANELGPDDLLRFAGSGFRDFTRIAGSSPEMWRDICLGNREALLKQIDSYLQTLSALRGLLARGDGEALKTVFMNARDTRRNWLQKTPLKS